MSVLALITGLIKLAAAVADYARNRQLIDAGVHQATAASLRATLENIDAATKAKHAMEHGGDPDWAQRVRNKYDRK